jgi:ribonuclease HI
MAWCRRIAANKRKKGGSEKIPDELWAALRPLLEMHAVTFEWVRGHDGDPDNERCDFLAQSEVARPF